MPNLVGIGNSQVPTNAMLGGLAYQDPSHANLTEVEIENIAAIKAKTADTAVDVFVYDTRKDSDGGAWRKRTQHTSWYNEGVSKTRGARKEFPAVAVIVASSSALTIYDADDPNLSMWMIFTSSNTTWLKHTTSGPNSVVAMNGIVVSCGAGGAGRLSVINFVSDNGYVTEAGYTYRHIWIATRNSTAVGPTDTTNPLHIVNIDCNDVAITVLPNAPIDIDTGLPIPTIAVATAGGVSVIRDNETVVDITSGTIIHHEPRSVAFLGTRLLWTEGNNYDLQDRVYLNAEVPSVDIVLPHTGALPSGYIGYGIGKGATNIFNNLSLNTTLNNEVSTPARERKFQIPGPDDTIVLGCKHAVNGGLELIHQDVNSPSNGMVATATTSYNTGWMHGDCKGAYLSDTDDTNMVSATANLLGSFGTFASASGWTLSGAGSFSISGGKLNSDGTSGASFAQRAQTPAIIRSHFTYTVKLVVTRTSGTLAVRVGNGSYSSTISSSGTYRLSVKAGLTPTETLLLYSQNFNGTIDDVEIYIEDQDRSSNDTGLQFYSNATMTKEPVATGADLVSYSGYTFNNYFETTTTAPGTGDFSITTWIKPGTNGSGTGNYLHLFNLSTTTTGGQSRGAGFVLKMVTNGSGGYSPYFYNADGGTNQGTYDANNRIPLGEWSQLIGMRRGGTAYIYLNGRVLKAGNAWTTNLTDTYLSLFRAPGFASEVGGDAKVALLRYSLSAPTDVQIKKMYDDEKYLFQENAKCTLYGTSSAVKAIAYDDSNDIVYAGTSSGRSDFVGLNRINNTTTAVTTAISASNELVVEQ